MFDAELIDEPDGVRLRLSGELDLWCAGPVGSELSNARGRAGDRLVVIDLREVLSVDSHAMHLLVLTHRTAERKGWPLEIIPGPPHVQRAFEISKLDAVLPFTDRKPQRSS